MMFSMCIKTASTEVNRMEARKMPQRLQKIYKLFLHNNKLVVKEVPDNESDRITSINNFVKEFIKAGYTQISIPSPSLILLLKSFFENDFKILGMKFLYTDDDMTEEINEMIYRIDGKESDFRQLISRLEEIINENMNEIENIRVRLNHNDITIHMNGFIEVDSYGNEYDALSRVEKIFRRDIHE